LDLLDQVVSTEILKSTIINDNNIPEIKSDFGFLSDIRVKKLIKEIKNSAVELVQDDYSVKVNLKDNTTYTFAPRRFAYMKRLQIYEITDDLFDRGIIKYSVLPYRARVVPVRKKNGTL